jgi:hypothetical protein
MSSSSDFELIHGQLHVTRGNHPPGSSYAPSKPEALGRQKNTIDGTAYFQGPVQFGNDKTFHPEEVAPFTAPIPKPEAVVMVGPLKNYTSSIPLICDERIKFIPEWSISPCGVERTGADKYEEKLAHPYPLVVRAGVDVTDSGAYGYHYTWDRKCGSGSTVPIKTYSEAAAIFIGDVDIYGYTRVRDKLSVCKNADFNSDIVIRKNVIIGGALVSKRNITSSANVKSQCGKHVLSRKKNFDIPHPSKEGWRLRHTCIEGPSNDVYIKGRVKNKTEISLPSYWKDFVDIQSIVVTLQPIGAHQDIIIKRWDENKVYLQSKSGIPIDCFYHIIAERIDGEKLISEYQGETPEDYPGDNSEYSVSGFHYDNKENV